MSVKAVFEHVGPEPEPSIAVPPISVGNAGYALVFDETRERLVYVQNPGYGPDLETWDFDGAVWTKGEGTVMLEGDERHAYWDPSLAGVAVWSVEFNRDAKRSTPHGVIVRASGSEPIVTTGEPPVLEDADGEMSDELGMLMTGDPLRRVGVCVARSGIYELDERRAWAKKGELGEALTAEWHSEGSSAWDPVGRRCVFWLQDREHYEVHFYAWDGASFTKLPEEGLPDLTIGLSDPALTMTGHPVHGMIVCVGGALYALGRGGWKALPLAKEPPPMMRESHLAYDRKRDAVVLGPGRFEGDPGGHDANDVFFLLNGASWTRQGVARPVSAVAPLGDHAFHARVGDAWFIADRSLATLEWTRSPTAGWRQVTSAKEGEAALPKSERAGAIAATPAGLVAVTQTGSVMRLEAGAWKLVAKGSTAFKGRVSFQLVHDAGTGRLVAWGGEVKNRRSNDTLFFDGKAWAQAKTTSPQPKDLFAKGYEHVDFALYFDEGLERVVRLSKSDVAVLEGDAWKSYTPKGYTEVTDRRSWQHFPASEAQSASGETLLLNLQTQKIARFDLAACTVVGSFDYPAEIVASAVRENNAHNVFSFFHKHMLFDPAARAVDVQYPKDTFARYALALGASFDAARKLGPRTLLGVPAAGHAPEPPRQVWVYGAKGDVVTPVRCKGDAKTLAAKKKEGFVEASALTPAMLERLATRTSSRLTVGKKLAASASLSGSRLGGLPSGVTLAKWPKAGKKPMGFLFQLRTGDLLSKHAGFAMFCVTSGTATEDETQNAVVLLTEKDFARAPIDAAPDGVPVLPALTIDVAAPLREVDEEKAEALGAKDPALGEAFERYLAKAKVQKAGLASKLGGAPQMLQGEEISKKTRFVAQLDFDEIRLDKAWKDAGLAGCVYVTVKEDEKAGAAFWQYT